LKVWAGFKESKIYGEKFQQKGVIESETKSEIQQKNEEEKGK